MLRVMARLVLAIRVPDLTVLKDVDARDKRGREGQFECPWHYSAAARRAAARVLAISIATVIRPTPPGTGVIAPARAAASA